VTPKARAPSGARAKAFRRNGALPGLGAGRLDPVARGAAVMCSLFANTMPQEAMRRLFTVAGGL